MGAGFPLEMIPIVHAIKAGKGLSVKQPLGWSRIWAHNVERALTRCIDKRVGLPFRGPRSWHLETKEFVHTM